MSMPEKVNLFHHRVLPLELTSTWARRFKAGIRHPVFLHAFPSICLLVLSQFLRKGRRVWLPGMNSGPSKVVFLTLRFKSFDLCCGCAKLCQVWLPTSQNTNKPTWELCQRQGKKLWKHKNWERLGMLTLSELMPMDIKASPVAPGDVPAPLPVLFPWLVACWPQMMDQGIQILLLGAWI